MPDCVGDEVVLGDRAQIPASDEPTRGGSCRWPCLSEPNRVPSAVSRDLYGALRDQGYNDRCTGASENALARPHGVRARKAARNLTDCARPERSRHGHRRTTRASRDQAAVVGTDLSPVSRSVRLSGRDHADRASEPREQDGASSNMAPRMIQVRQPYLAEDVGSSSATATATALGKACVLVLEDSISSATPRRQCRNLRQACRYCGPLNC